MTAATPTRPGSETEAGGSKAQHALILAFCSSIAGMTRLASLIDALGIRLDAEAELNDAIVGDNLRKDVSNGKCW
jgi:hypothetical protein